eukprot:TRINITY_DN61445_c0_g1_i1.p1 TRINITY_DN61445_c0_g1~~TRINITY_DN61445_c0_g1_i1.p1  ORF type:complete len:526 (+),score=95.18 TRINITY_DN61445_c0_g1_i1:189-1766(+)
MATCMAVALSLLGIAMAADMYTDNFLCTKNNCIKPIFPAMEDMHQLNETKWYCTAMKETQLSLTFCKGAVGYDVAVPRPESKAEDSVEALIRKQDRAANTAFMYHLAGMGKDGWDYPDPARSDDDCIKDIWRLACYTYFPRSGVGCALGSETSYIRPCKSSCQNYLKSCNVQCCDESVQCVFDHKKQLTKTTFLETSGYAPHDGPSSLCTGAAERSGGPGILTALLVLAALLMGVGENHGVSLHQSLPGARSLHMLVVLAFLCLSLQGCDGPHSHKVGNWRQADDYLMDYQFVPPGESSKEAVLNSCSVPGLSAMVQCSGHGGCETWPTSQEQNPTPFCKCDPGWADPECRTPRKSQAWAYFLAIFFGILGADRFYLGFTYSAWLKLLTLGILSIYWVTEWMITGSPTVQLQRDIRSWSGLLKVIFCFSIGSWYFIDVIRVGSAPLETYSFRAAPDLPHKVFVASSVFLAMIAGFLIAAWNVTALAASKRSNLWLMQQAYSQEKAALDEGVLTQGIGPAASYGSF